MATINRAEVPVRDRVKIPMESNYVEVYVGSKATKGIDAQMRSNSDKHYTKTELEFAFKDYGFFNRREGAANFNMITVGVYVNLKLRWSFIVNRVDFTEHFDTQDNVCYFRKLLNIVSYA